jgi:hypothetical protein
MAKLGLSSESGRSGVLSKVAKGPRADLVADQQPKPVGAATILWNAASWTKIEEAS